MPAFQVKGDAEELQSQMAQSSVSSLTLEALSSGRGDDGRFGSHCWELRVVIWGMLARRCPPSSIADNIVETLRLIVPVIEPAMPSKEMIRRMRGELTIAGETMTALRIASCKRVLSFGFDESTKKQVSLLSTNVQIDNEDGDLANVVPRGASVLCGGTGEKVAEGIERLFTHLRRLVDELRAAYDKRWGSGSWRGPDSTRIGMNLLGDRCIIMSDTCTMARKTCRLVQDMVRVSVEAKMGAEAYAALSVQEKSEKAGALAGHCWQHMRNIFLDAMAAGANSYLETALEDWLEKFVPQERMSVGIMEIIRAAYKQFHHGAPTLALEHACRAARHVPFR
jgi:hypothetical protein